MPYRGIKLIWSHLHLLSPLAFESFIFVSFLACFQAPLLVALIGHVLNCKKTWNLGSSGNYELCMDGVWILANQKWRNTLNE